MVAGLENTGGTKQAALGQIALANQARAARILPEHVKAAAQGHERRHNIAGLALAQHAPRATLIRSRAKTWRLSYTWRTVAFA
jgi:hypothetical protein